MTLAVTSACLRRLMVVSSLAADSAAKAEIAFPGRAAPTAPAAKTQGNAVRRAKRGRG